MVKNRIAALRHEADLSQKELGQKLGIVQSAISAWELGRNQPDFAAMQKMAQLFHCSIDYLMDRSIKSATRGLSQQEFDEWQRQLYQAQGQAELEKKIAELEGPECGLTDEEIDKILTQEQRENWDKVKELMLFEAFQINDLMETMDAEQRKYCLEQVERFSTYCQTLPKSPK